MKIFVLIFFVVCVFTDARAQWYFGTGEAVNLTNGIKYNNGVKNISGALNPSSTAVNAPAGSLYESTNGSLYVKQDSGSSTNWFPLAVAGSGLQSINGLLGPAISIITGSTGTDFNIASSSNTVNINLPTSSAANRGLLSAADWSTFNGKQPAGNYITALTGDGTATGPGSATLTIPTATAGNKGLLSASDWSTFNGKQSALVNSAGLAAAINDETGTGLAVFSASPTLTGDPQVPTATVGDSDNSVASTAFTQSAVTAATGTNSTQAIMLYPTASAFTPIFGVNVITSNGTYTFTLPTPVGNTGKTVTVKRGTASTTGNVSIGTLGAETVDGVTGVSAIVMNQSITGQSSNPSVSIISDGTNWHTIMRQPFGVNTGQSTVSYGNSDLTFRRFTSTTTAGQEAVVAGNGLFSMTPLANTTAGANVIFSNSSVTGFTRLTGALTSLSGFAASGSGRFWFYTNNTGGTITINNEDTVNVASASQRISTLTGGNLSWANGTSVMFMYDGNLARHTPLVLGASISNASTPTVQTLTTTQTVTNYGTYLVSSSAGAVTLTLPTAVGNTGKTIVVKKTDSSANAVVMDPNGAETIDNAATVTTTLQYQAFTIQSDGANWFQI